MDFSFFRKFRAISSTNNRVYGHPHEVLDPMTPKSILSRLRDPNHPLSSLSQYETSGALLEACKIDRNSNGHTKAIETFQDTLAYHLQDPEVIAKHGYEKISTVERDAVSAVLTYLDPKDMELARQHGLNIDLSQKARDGSFIPGTTLCEQLLNTEHLKTVLDAGYQTNLSSSQTFMTAGRLSAESAPDAQAPFGSLGNYSFSVPEGEYGSQLFREFRQLSPYRKDAMGKIYPESQILKGALKLRYDNVNLLIDRGHIDPEISESTDYKRLQRKASIVTTQTSAWGEGLSEADATPNDSSRSKLLKARAATYHANTIKFPEPKTTPVDIIR